MILHVIKIMRLFDLSRITLKHTHKKHKIRGFFSLLACHAWTEVSIFFFPNFVANMYSKDDHLKSRTMFQASIFFNLFFFYDYRV